MAAGDELFAVETPDQDAEESVLRAISFEGALLPSETLVEDEGAGLPSVFATPAGTTLGEPYINSFEYSDQFGRTVMTGRAVLVRVSNVQPGRQVLKAVSKTSLGNIRVVKAVIVGPPAEE